MGKYEQCKEIMQEYFSLKGMTNTQNFDRWIDHLIEKNKKKKRTISDDNKKKYLDFVLLGIEEYDKLVAEFGEKNLKEIIYKLNTYIGSTGKKYKSHYWTLKNWAKRSGIKKPSEKINIVIEKGKQLTEEEKKVARDMLIKARNSFKF